MILNGKTVELQIGDNVVELQMTPVLVEKIKAAFNLTLDQQVTEKHVKYYLVNGMRNALEAGDEQGSS